jgi:hypothetical protein
MGDGESSDLINIWSLEKDPAIKSLLVQLQSHLGENKFIIEENNHLNHHSIFLHHTQHWDVRAFIFTFGQQPDHYGIHLEYPIVQSAGNLIDIHENISFKSLVSILAVHFDIAQIDHEDLL